MSLFARKHHKLSKRAASTECHFRKTEPSCVKLPISATFKQNLQIFAQENHTNMNRLFILLIEATLHHRHCHQTCWWQKRSISHKADRSSFTSLLSHSLSSDSHYNTTVIRLHHHTIIQLSSDSHYSLQYHCNKLAPSTILYHHFTDP